MVSMRTGMGFYWSILIVLFDVKNTVGLRIRDRCLETAQLLNCLKKKSATTETNPMVKSLYLIQDPEK